MPAIAADWRSPTPRAVDEVLMLPELTHYVDGRPAPGDFGLLAEMDDPIGAEWWRYFPAHDPGYGFVDEETPEISIGVVPEVGVRGSERCSSRPSSARLRIADFRA